MNTEDIKRTLDRNAKALELRPSLGQVTAKTRARIRSGLTCDIEEGKWKLVSDVHPKSGGDANGPDPSLMMRAALAGCLAIGYASWAARMEIPLTNVEVEVEGDFDVRGQMGHDEIPAGYSEIRYNVSIESSAPEADVMRLLDTTDANSPLIDVFTREQRLVRDVRITKPQE